MKTVKVTFCNGHSLVTSINGTHDEIIVYYVGRHFNLGGENDLMAKGVSVQFLS